MFFDEAEIVALIKNNKITDKVYNYIKSLVLPLTYKQTYLRFYSSDELAHDITYFILRYFKYDESKASFRTYVIHCAKKYLSRFVVYEHYKKKKHINYDLLFENLNSYEKVRIRSSILENFLENNNIAKEIVCLKLQRYCKREILKHLKIQEKVYNQIISRLYKLLHEIDY